MEAKKTMLEDKILKAILTDNGCTARFDYSSCGFLWLQKQITVTTCNPRTFETFLYKKVIVSSVIKGLEEILEYAQNHKADYNAYTVVWSKKGNFKEEKSHFYCKDILEVLEKFFHDKKREDYIIYSVSMNPIS